MLFSLFTLQVRCAFCIFDLVEFIIDCFFYFGAVSPFVSPFVYDSLNLLHFFLMFSINIKIFRRLFFAVFDYSSRSRLDSRRLNTDSLGNLLCLVLCCSWYWSIFDITTSSCLRCCDCIPVVFDYLTASEVFDLVDHCREHLVPTNALVFAWAALVILLRRFYMLGPAHLVKPTLADLCCDVL